MGIRRRSALAHLLSAALLVLPSCSFDYSSLSEEEGEETPDLVMEDVEYVRVEKGKPVVRLQARSAERFEKDQRMILEYPRFSQYSGDGTAGAVGSADSASVDMASGDVVLSGDVRLSIPSEDVLIETGGLYWFDETRSLRGTADGRVLIKRADGSFLSGRGFEADGRSKAWNFLRDISGLMVEEEAAADETEAAPEAAPGEEPAAEAAPDKASAP